MDNEPFCQLIGGEFFTQAIEFVHCLEKVLFRQDPGFIVFYPKMRRLLLWKSTSTCSRHQEAQGGQQTLTSAKGKALLSPVWAHVTVCHLGMWVMGEAQSQQMGEINMTEKSCKSHYVLFWSKLLSVGHKSIRVCLCQESA